MASSSPVKKTNGTNGLPQKSEQETAIREAQECLDAMKQEGFQLDGFNLLGVVANPLSGMSPQSMHAIRNGANNHLASPKRESSQTGEGETEPDMITDAFHSLGNTLSHVTEQIDTFNVFLEELSKEYLGDDSGESLFLEYYYQNEEEEEIPVPSELANLSLDEVESYLGKSGELATSLFTLGLETRSSMGEDASKSLDETPQIFSNSDFDLTQSKTFLQLLLEGNGEENSKGANATTKNPARSDSVYQPTNELVPLKDPDSLAGYLDKVELALQEQVRQKAGAFFQETTKFRQLQSSIEDLLMQVQMLRNYINQISSVYKQTKDISNHQRQNYEEFVDLIDLAMELVRCKASIGGLLSANDYLGAAEQIQYGRRLLRGESPNNSSNEREPTVELQQVAALSSCAEQFSQYESLVVQSLSEELVDAFFNWRSNDEERVTEVVAALNLCHAMQKTGEVYQRRLQQTIRMTVRTTIAEFVESSGTGGSGVTGMANPAFYDCLQLLIEEILSVLKTAQNVDNFSLERNLFEGSPSRWTNEALLSGADLAAKSIAEILRLRKEAHSLINLEEMKQLWDSCMSFTLAVEGFGMKTKAVGLRSTLSGQAKAFLDRTHESNMAALVHALDSERWVQCEVSTERQEALTRLCTGRAIGASFSRLTTQDGRSDNGVISSEKKPTAEVEGTIYKVVWSCLLLVEMIMTNMSAAASFQSPASIAVAKVTELLRLFNARTTHLVLGAGAIQSAARLKSINAKHLSMVTQCLGMILALLPHIRAALMAQLPPKQHTLLSSLDRIKKDYVDHNEKVLNKFVTIIGGIVEHGLAPRIATIDFDARARDLKSDDSKLACCVFLEGISTNTRKMHQVLNALLPPDHLQDVFSRIFAFVDQKVPTLFIEAASGSKKQNGKPSFRLPSTDEGKLRMILEVEYTTEKLNSLAGVLPWDFTAMSVLKRKLDFPLQQTNVPEDIQTDELQEPPENTGSADADEVPQTDLEQLEDKVVTNEESSNKTKEDEMENGDGDDSNKANDDEIEKDQGIDSNTAQDQDMGSKLPVPALNG